VIRPDPITVSRDCAATTVPYGEAVTLPAGSGVTVLQALGGNVTVRDTFGRLFRLAGSDADAVGLDPIGRNVTIATKKPFTLEQVWDALRTVYDPEMSLNVVELGLVYRCDETIDGGRRTISIDMTMTAPGCGMGDILRHDVLRAVGALPGVDDVEVTIVFDPPWCVDRMPEDVRLSLGLL
jgi:probable FeS assembly SUF system protein SufT